MNLNIDFDELVEAFDFCSENLHFFIDLEKEKIVSIDEMEEDAEKKLEKIVGERYIEIPIKDSREEFNVMESFVYETHWENFNLAEKFHDILEKKYPFRNFKELLKAQSEELEMKWYNFRDKELKNRVINWLYENDIELNQSVIPKIEIKELNRVEAEKVIDELKHFSPLACMECDSKKGLKQRFFLLNVPIENILIEKEIKRILKDKYNFEHFGYYISRKTIVVASKCSNCGSENIFWDY